MFNPSVPHKSHLFSALKIRQFNTNSSVPQKSSVPQNRLTNLPEGFVWNWYICVKMTGLCRTDEFVSKWRICVDLTHLCWTDGFVSIWRICVELTDLCWTDGFVLNRRICVELTDLCWNDGFVFNWWICVKLTTFFYDPVENFSISSRFEFGKVKISSHSGSWMELTCWIEWYPIRKSRLSEYWFNIMFYYWKLRN